MFKRFNNSKNPSITICIPTCYGGLSLIKVVRNIFNSSEGIEFRIIVVADTIPLEKKILSELNSLGVKVIENKKRSSQINKIFQMVEMVETDLIMTTQDDVRFEKGIIKEVASGFANKESLSMAGINILPDKNTSLLQRILSIGVLITYEVATKWRNGDNYLLSNGRCLAFRTKMIQKFRRYKDIVNSDAYFYFENKRLNGEFQFLPKAIVYNKLPKKISEHLNQTNRFQYSLNELSSLFSPQIENDYHFPKALLFSALLKSLLNSPFLTTLYLFLSLFARIKKQELALVSNSLWKIDRSTKLEK